MPFTTIAASGSSTQTELINFFFNKTEKLLTTKTVNNGVDQSLP